MRNSTPVFKYALATLLAGSFSVWAENPMITDGGVGAKALSMGNSFVAVADDFTAVYWNPAGLAFTPVRELQFSLDALRSDAQTDLAGTNTDVMQQRLRIGHAGLLRSIPTSRGGVAFAIGLIRPWVLDNVYNAKGTDTYTGEGQGSLFNGDTILDGDTISYTLHTGDQLTYLNAEKHISGQINMIPISLGWQFAEGWGVGVTVAPIFGTEYQKNKYATTKDGRYYFEHTQEKNTRFFYGFNARMGVMYAPGERLRVGMRLEMPQVIGITQNYSISDSAYPDYPIEYKNEQGSLTTNFSGAVGASYKLPFMLVSTEATFRSPTVDAESGSPLSVWKPGVSAGVEVPLTFISTLLRAGYQWKELDLYPYVLEWEAEAFPFETRYRIDQNRRMFTGGFAILIKDYATIEAAYAYSMWKYAVVDPDWQNSISESHASHRFQVSFSLRY
jgi:hypothetical protein